MGTELQTHAGLPLSLVPDKLSHNTCSYFTATFRTNLLTPHRKIALITTHHHHCNSNSASSKFSTPTSSFAWVPRQLFLLSFSLTSAVPSCLVFFFLGWWCMWGLIARFLIVSTRWRFSFCQKLRHTTSTTMF